MDNRAADTERRKVTEHLCDAYPHITARQAMALGDLRVEMKRISARQPGIADPGLDLYTVADGVLRAFGLGSDVKL